MHAKRLFVDLLRNVYVDNYGAAFTAYACMLLPFAMHKFAMHGLKKIPIIVLHGPLAAASPLAWSSFCRPTVAQRRRVCKVS